MSLSSQYQLTGLRSFLLGMVFTWRWAANTFVDRGVKYTGKWLLTIRSIE